MAGVAAAFIAFFGHGASSTGPDHTPPPNDFFRPHASSTSTTLNPTTVACVAAAVAAREQTLDAGVATYTQSINTAYTTRASALASAYAQTGGSDVIRKAVNTAWQSFRAAIQLGRKTWVTAHESAWTTFRTAAKACGASATTLSDTNDESLDSVNQ